MSFFCRSHFTNNLDKWSSYYNAKEPHNEELPTPFDTELNDFQKMIVLRCIRPDKVSIILKTDIYLQAK